MSAPRRPARPRPGSALAIGAALVSALGLGAWAARGAGGVPASPSSFVPPAELEHPVGQMLSGIDFVPDRGAFDGLLGSGAQAELLAIARGEKGAMNDPGLRIRAYRALALYPSSDTESALLDAVAQHGGATSGVDIVYLRAAMESLAQVASSGSLVSVAIATLAPMLDHPLRDVRADAARALGATGGADAVPVLRARLAEEELLQVRLAIAEALRRLGESDEGNEGTK
jgi:hypothetical protein